MWKLIHTLQQMIEIALFKSSSFIGLFKNFFFVKYHIPARQLNYNLMCQPYLLDTLEEHFQMVNRYFC
jgi:hypothetical protein